MVFLAYKCPHQILKTAIPTLPTALPREGVLTAALFSQAQDKEAPSVSWLTCLATERQRCCLCPQHPRAYFPETLPVPQQHPRGRNNLVHKAHLQARSTRCFSTRCSAKVPGERSPQRKRRSCVTEIRKRLSRFPAVRRSPGSAQPMCRRSPARPASPSPPPPPARGAGRSRSGLPRPSSGHGGAALG